MKPTRVKEPTVLVIFGATGDLTRRKLMPALFDLFRQQLLPKLIRVIGFSRRPLSQSAFREMMKKAVSPKEGWDGFAKILHYHQGTFEDSSGYKKLAARIGKADRDWKGCINALFYLATPPTFYKQILEHLASSGLMEACSPQEGWTRILVEKPFGKDLASAQKLDRKLGELFREEQIFRIDHFLGKETIQNIMAFRFGNPIFEPIWNRTYVERVEVRLLETLGIEGRGAFYDGIGALRDVGQNHLLQMVALTAMEPPASFEPEAVRNERVKVFQSIRCIEPSDVGRYTVRGQHSGYTDEEGVSSRSHTETYFRIKFFINNTRWEDVPFFLESGKRLDRDLTEVSVFFHEIAHHLFPHQPKQFEQNILRLRIQPDEAISLRLLVKRPGIAMQLDPQELRFDYRSSFEERFVEAYEKVLLDCIAGDQTIFARSDGIEASWEFITKIIHGWQKDGAPLHVYEPGSSGPKAKDTLA
ncbi:glucose-6-phosphate dehydrogenase [Patescibacteria group bacterium]|nr:glucose-6-phosphate dehydrogenase [Patescibacteria group bacterium]